MPPHISTVYSNILERHEVNTIEVPIGFSAADEAPQLEHLRVFANDAFTTFSKSSIIERGRILQRLHDAIIAKAEALNAAAVAEYALRGAGSEASTSKRPGNRGSANADRRTRSAAVLSMLNSLHLAKVVEGDLAWP
jgi:hypothetical protein